MAKTTPVSLRLDPDLNDRIAAIAVALGRPKSWAIEQAVRDYVAVQEWQLATIKEGVEDADAGRVVDHGEVAGWIASWGSDTPKPAPQARRCD
jgi:predicted transcriptional regulator